MTGLLPYREETGELKCTQSMPLSSPNQRLLSASKDILSTVLFCNPLLMEITFISSFSKSSKQTPSCTEPSASKDWLRAAQNTRLCCIKLSATLLNFCTVSP